MMLNELHTKLKPESVEPDNEKLEILLNLYTGLQMLCDSILNAYARQEIVVKIIVDKVKYPSDVSDYGLDGVLEDITDDASLALMYEGKDCFGGTKSILNVFNAWSELDDDNEWIDKGVRSLLMGYVGNVTLQARQLLRRELIEFSPPLAFANNIPDDSEIPMPDVYGLAIIVTECLENMNADVPPPNPDDYLKLLQKRGFVTSGQLDWRRILVILGEYEPRYSMAMANYLSSGQVM